MNAKAAEREKRKQPESTVADVIPPHYALRDFSHVKGNHTYSQRKGDIIRDQQKLYVYKQQGAPIAPFNERMTAKCPNPKCGHVFAWDGNA